MGVPSRWRSFRALGHEAKSDCSPTPARSAGRQAQTPESVRTVRSPFSGLAPHLERESSQPSTPCRHTALTADGGGWWLRRQRLLRDTLTWSLSREEPGDLSSPGEGCRRQAAPKEQTQTKGGKMSEDEMGDIGHQECDKEAYEESGWPEAEEAKSGLAKLTRVGAKCPEHGLGEIASAADRTTILCEKSRPLMLSAAAISSFGLKGFRARRLAASMASIDRGAQTGSASHADDRNVHEADDYGHATQPAEWANELEKVTTEAMVAFEAPGKSIISSKAVEQTKATTKCIVTTSKETSTIANLVADSQSAIDASGEPARPSRTRRRRRLTLLLLNYLKLARAHSIGDSSSRGDDESSTGASGRLDSSSPPRRWHRLAVEPEYQSSDQSNWRTDKRGRQEERYREISSTGVNAKHNYGAISHSLDEEPKCLYDTKGSPGSVAECLACQALILHCRGSTPAECVDKTKTAVHSSRDENNVWESKAM
ncbi:unnamed protein product [Protopolystoma xenopodis]|uniref:Uncharacterized protein n=1 Tax=Protopolystoma xenopodis TaxID=117903 RepID=A0A3S5CSL8_9PLAT|nr:unnamed protein product [Protopolystoma xenopodis]